jgi:hypothetical protein
MNVAPSVTRPASIRVGLFAPAGAGAAPPQPAHKKNAAGVNRRLMVFLGAAVLAWRQHFTR